jgi:hypothetical protein
MLRVVLLIAILAIGLAATGCGSSSDAPAGSSGGAQRTGTAPSGRLNGVVKYTNLRVVNRSGRDMVADMCHDGHCIGHHTLKEGQSVQVAGDDVSGWVSYAWGMGNGNQQNQYTGARMSAPGPYRIDFWAGNPVIGQPWIDAKLPARCNYETSQAFGGGNDKPARWTLGVGDRERSPENALCTYALVASRARDGGTDRVTGAPADYKMLTLEAYAPKPVYVSNRGCIWEGTPGPVIKPESPDGSWSCWKPGPQPPADTPVTREVP